MVNKFNAVRPLGMLMAAMSFVCNTLVVLTVARSQSLRQPSLLMLCSLSITDVIFAIHALLRDALITTDPHFCSEPFREEGTYLGILCYLATRSILTMISRDRYLAVSKPSWYRNHMTQSRAFKGNYLKLDGEHDGYSISVHPRQDGFQ